MRLVDADALMRDINEALSEMTSIGIAVDGDWLWAKLNDAIEHAPTIEERKTGKWRYSRNISSISYSDMMITCDQCGYTKERSHDDVFNFCPSCGAKMEGNT